MPGIFDLPFQKKEMPSPAPATPAPSSEGKEPLIQLYRLIIDRYRDTIEERETKSVSDLQRMVQPRDEIILKLRDSITEGFHPYVYEEHFLQAAESSFTMVSSFRTVFSPVSFWLTFAEMQSLSAGEEIDKSIFLCSLLRSLGSENAKVFVTDPKSAQVLFQFNAKSFIADCENPKITEKASGAEALSSLKGKLLYSFNDKEYEDFQEDGA
ncbi:MAG: hypothetical protein WC588_03600 [Candidatus Micrarchaeia archaeon]